LSGQEIAILHARDCGVREIARRLGRSASTSPMTTNLGVQLWFRG
jgi:Helix-turn-helix domain